MLQSTALQHNWHKNNCHDFPNRRIILVPSILLALCKLLNSEIVFTIQKWHKDSQLQLFLIAQPSLGVQAACQLYHWLHLAYNLVEHQTKSICCFSFILLVRYLKQDLILSWVSSQRSSSFICGIYLVNAGAKDCLNSQRKHRYGSSETTSQCFKSARSSAIVLNSGQCSI